MANKAVVAEMKAAGLHLKGSDCWGKFVPGAGAVTIHLIPATREWDVVVSSLKGADMDSFPSHREAIRHLQRIEAAIPTD